MRNVLKAMIASGLCLAALPLKAETLNVSGIYPAGNDAAAELNTIAVEPFGGVDGPTLSLALEDRLRNVSIEGEPYFQVLPSSFASGAEGDVDAVLRGTVTTRTSTERSYPKKDKKCVARNDKGKCTEKVEIEIPCRTLNVYIQPRLRLVGRRGELIHSENPSIEQEQRYCRDEEKPFADPMIEEALSDFVRSIRYEFAPVQRTEGIRLLEARKGMKGEPRKAFRNAIKLTKSDPLQACLNFEALQESLGEHVSLLYNLGLCAESDGDFEAATLFYDRALLADPKKSLSQQGLNRIAARARADIQLAAHYGPVEALEPEAETDANSGAEADSDAAPAPAS
ncbi:MAG: hypothetical protein ABJP34_11045 [Erythrobacter sp.]